jgi:hypothetical protein
MKLARPGLAVGRSPASSLYGGFNGEAPGVSAMMSARPAERFCCEVLKRKLSRVGLLRLDAAGAWTAMRAARAPVSRRPIQALCQSAGFVRLDETKDRCRIKPRVMKGRSFAGAAAFMV